MSETIYFNGFGLAPLKAEGMALHPDELECDLSDEQYVRQLQAFKDWAGEQVYLIACSRPELLQKLH